MPVSNVAKLLKGKRMNVSWQNQQTANAVPTVQTRMSQQQDSQQQRQVPPE